MNTLYEKIEKMGIIPVVVLKDAKNAEKLSDALCLGGLACAEVTFRTDAAEESIRIMANRHPEMLIAAGTVLTTDQVDRAIKAGASFIVSPGFNPAVVSYCLENNITIIPGCCTPSEVEQALSLGLKIVKFFPAEAAGGLAMIKAMSAPYHMMRFMPTGGISPDNVRDYLSCDSVIACGGSWMVKDTLIENGDFEQIRILTKGAAEIKSKICSK